jgi:hypothetical protein
MKRWHVHYIDKGEREEWHCNVTKAKLRGDAEDLFRQCVGDEYEIEAITTTTPVDELPKSHQHYEERAIDWKPKLFLRKLIFDRNGEAVHK